MSIKLGKDQTIMFNIETKQSIKRFIGRTMKFFSNNKDKNLSVILNYHSIHPSHKFATKPGDFREQMEYTASNFKVLSLHDLYEMRISKKNFPDKLAVITFDDGYEDNYEYAFPVLKNFGIKASIFLTTGFIDGEIDIAKRDRTYNELQPLKWEQILEMKDSGIITFGSHTHTHPILTEISLEDAEKEIVQSKNILEDKLGESAELFAYPLGQPKTFNTQIIELLKKHGFKLACSARWGHNNDTADLFALQRIRIDACDTLSDFKDKINGKWDFIRWVQRLK